MAYFLLAKSNFVSNQETEYRGRKGFSDFFFSGYYVNISFQCTYLGNNTWMEQFWILVVLLESVFFPATTVI